ncbi:MAG: penicillin-binding protein 1A [Rhodospirillaceae bacterium]|jgi:penicillin-binding protein 1A|nr:penicillin-binding protein 1A [Rhodospirillaceae bacterium]
MIYSKFIKNKNILLRFLILFFSSTFTFISISAVSILGIIWYYGHDLPDYHKLSHYEPPVTTRVYSNDGRLIIEYALEKRSFVPIIAIPQLVINAFLSAEDKNFYNHIGIDMVGIARAILINIKNHSFGNNRRSIGASTITQQVARNFLLTNEISISRKIKEVILSFRIEQAFTKQHILELYLNEIYLGNGAYGVATAALHYFDKSLDELSISEVAFLASLPKAPSRNPQTLRERRDYVIRRMVEDNCISIIEARSAMTEMITTRHHDEVSLVFGGEYFAEDIRRKLAEQYGEDSLYMGGLTVHSTLDPKLQESAIKTLRVGLESYDRKHGWRGALTKIDVGTKWNLNLEILQIKFDLMPWLIAVVIATTADRAEIGFKDGSNGYIPMSELLWARKAITLQKMGPIPKQPSDVLQIGDVVAVEAISKSGNYSLRQPPKVEGALIAIDPHTGRVLAMQGGFSYARSQFNRATQALRQPGSSFKPFVYLVALDNGYTPSSLILDSPIELDQGIGMPKWHPKNYNNDYLGPTTLRVGLEKSRNLMAVRLAATVGITNVANYAEKFGITDKLPHKLSMALGAGETTPMKLTAAYAQIVNGGRKITPTLIDRIQNRNGTTIYRHDKRICTDCNITSYNNQNIPEISSTNEQLIDPMTAYQMVHILEGVVARGTGKAVASIGKPIAGKTGTSNDSKDAWFVGFSSNLAVGVFIGFDDSTSLGKHELGSTIAAPIFRDFMIEALKNKPSIPFRVPHGIRFVRVNANTGKPVQSDETNVIYEAFKPNSSIFDVENQIINVNGKATFTPITALPQAGGLY